MILEKNNYKQLILDHLLKIYLILVIFILLIQVFFGRKNSNIKAFLEIVPTAHNDKTMKAFMFGDEEFFFRTKVFKIQNMGDTFGRFTALYKYDYKKLYDWIYSLDKINSKSNVLPALSAYYFSQIQTEALRIYPIKYLIHHAEKNLKEKWWWLYQAAYLAQYLMHDNELAIEIATKLQKNVPQNANIPIWIRNTLTLYLINTNKECEALRIIEGIINSYENLDKESNKQIKQEKEKELDYMNYFVKNILDTLNKKQIDLSKCKK